MYCWRLRCAGCVRRCAYVRSLAIADARPERMVTVTRVGDDWGSIRARMKELRYRLVCAERQCDWVWTVEANPRGTGHHVHAWQRGSYLPQRELSALARRCGMGTVADVRKWVTPDDDSVGYGLKNASVGYGLKDASGEGSLGWLALNGGRLTHQSREFFAGGVRSCERAALEARGDGLGTWEIVSVESLRWDAAGGPSWVPPRPRDHTRRAMIFPTTPDDG